MKIDKTHFRGAFLGGAAADAQAYNTRLGGLDLISDNTQMASFTVDGLIWAKEKAKRKGVYAYVPCLFYSYQKWYYTQTGSLADKSYAFILDGDILKWDALFARRGEGMTSLKALEGSLHNKYGTLKNRINNSKGCGGVMRVAPVGMCFAEDADAAFRVGCESAALTHGHMGGIAPAGYLAALVALTLQGMSLEAAVAEARGRLAGLSGAEGCLGLLEKAEDLAGSDVAPESAVALLGRGFTGDELVALATYCVLRFKGGIRETVGFAKDFEGNNLSLATICGNITGTFHGAPEIPFEWIKDLELLELFIIGSDKLFEETRG
ncbi:MAG: ADP-ribosylglycohydrolase family protein [Clostridiales Family XIII bacterium]|jgi:ADP-ribosylglycohydrolase|nr:ADP-ribosylglycohydrolase family protein [Clostridiales Family XIII bacterium]